MKKMIFSAMILMAFAFATNAQGLQIGDKAPSFTLKNIDDKMVSLDDYAKEKGVIVIFTCNHCPYSIAYEDRIIAIDKEFKAKGYPVVAINPNDPIQYPTDSFDAMKERAKEKGFTFPYLFDEDQAIYPQYGATKTPHVYVLKKVKKGFEVAYIGAIDNSAKDASSVTEHYLSDAVNDLIAGNAPKVATTKAIGCGIKAKK